MPDIGKINRGPTASQLIRLAYENKWELEGAFFEMERHYDAFYHIAHITEQRKALVQELRELGLVKGKHLIDVDVAQLMEDLNLHV
tara:strand:- start:25442 stop:25699 length:258 start_codon:yes stop_codon:yes gene_type:complete